MFFYINSIFIRSSIESEVLGHLQMVMKDFLIMEEEQLKILRRDYHG